MREKFTGYQHNGNSRTWAHDEQCCNRTSCAQVYDLTQTCYRIYEWMIGYTYIYIVHMINAIENSLEYATGGVLEKIVKKNPDGALQPAIILKF